MQVKKANCNLAFDYGRHNTYWQLPDLEFIRRMDPHLRRYLCFAFGRVIRMDYLRAMDDDLADEILQNACAKVHAVWETAVWIQVANRKLVQRLDNSFHIIPSNGVLATDKVLPNELIPCHLQVEDSGQYHIDLTDDLTDDKSEYVQRLYGE